MQVKQFQLGLLLVIPVRLVNSLDLFIDLWRKKRQKTILFQGTLQKSLEFTKPYYLTKSLEVK